MCVYDMRGPCRRRTRPVTCRVKRTVCSMIGRIGARVWLAVTGSSSVIGRLSKVKLFVSDSFVGYMTNHQWIWNWILHSEGWFFVWLFSLSLFSWQINVQQKWLILYLCRKKTLKVYTSQFCKMEIYATSALSTGHQHEIIQLLILYYIDISHSPSSINFGHLRHPVFSQFWLNCYVIGVY